MATFHNDIGASSFSPESKVMPRPPAIPYILLAHLPTCKEAARETHSSIEPRAKAPHILETLLAGEGMKKRQERTGGKGKRRDGREEGGNLPMCPPAASLKNKI